MDDPALLVRGASPYVADLSEPDLLHAAFVRSPFAHARILTIDSVEAALQPGVAAVLTATDLALVPVPGFDAFAAGFARAPLAESVVRFAGEPVAIVLA